MNGEGRYKWRDRDYVLHEATNWNDIPDDIGELLLFLPDAPPSPHSDADHEYLESFEAKFDEVFARCRR